jgi:hypothetical protein
MDPNYETILETENLIWTMLAYGIHGVIVFLYASLSGFLLATGVLGLATPDFDRPWLRTLGTVSMGEPNTRFLGAIRLGLALCLIAPLVLGAPMGLSLLASLASATFLIFRERGLSTSDKDRGRAMRFAAIFFACVSSLFMLWEREDNLVLGADLLVHSMEWRNEELAWQLRLDPESPKVGDLAPDFELQNPEGDVQIRLSDFRGKRPVALIFGSYT